MDAAKSASSSFDAEKAALVREKGDLSAKVEELEVDVLEAKETAEKAVEESAKTIAALKQAHWEEKDALTKSLQEDLRVAVEKHDAATKLWEESAKEKDASHVNEKAAALAEAQTHANQASKEALEALAAEHSNVIAAKEQEHATLLEELKSSHEEAQTSLREVIKGLNTDLQVRRRSTGTCVVSG